MVYLEPGCHIQSFDYLKQFYLYSLGKIVNKQRIVCDRIPGSRYSLMLTCIYSYVYMYTCLHVLIQFI